MPASVESRRPIMAPSLAATNRYSQYSMQAPSLTGTIQTTDSTVADIRTIATGLERMDNPVLSSQRVCLTEQKAEDMKKLALGAKLDRALERRMKSQDAVMRPRAKTASEKEKMVGDDGTASSNTEATSSDAKNNDGSSGGNGNTERRTTVEREDASGSQHTDDKTAIADSSFDANLQKYESPAAKSVSDQDPVASPKV